MSEMFEVVKKKTRKNSIYKLEGMLRFKNMKNKAMENIALFTQLGLENLDK